VAAAMPVARAGVMAVTGKGAVAAAAAVAGVLTEGGGRQVWRWCRGQQRGWRREGVAAHAVGAHPRIHCRTKLRDY